MPTGLRRGRRPPQFGTRKSPKMFCGKGRFRAWATPARLFGETDCLSLPRSTNARPRHLRWAFTETRRRQRTMTFSRSEEHTSELQSPCNLVCRLLLEKKKKNNNYYRVYET